MKHGYFWKANRRQTIQKSKRLLKNKKSLCRVSETATMVPVLSQVNSAKTLT